MDVIRRFSLLAGCLILVSLTGSCKRSEKEPANIQTSKSNVKTEKYVFPTTDLKRYEFPTHINDLIVDRKYASNSEVFMVIVEPKKSVHHHKHEDTEQIFYMIEGEGILFIGKEKRKYPVKPGDVIRIPLSTLHSVESNGTDTVKYLCVDCFCDAPLESTWDKHVKAVCKEKGWDYNDVVSK